LAADIASDLAQSFHRVFTNSSSIPQPSRSRAEKFRSQESGRVMKTQNVRKRM
jgi:hypothetical protein